MFATAATTRSLATLAAALVTIAAGSPAATATAADAHAGDAFPVQPAGPPPPAPLTASADRTDLGHVLVGEAQVVSLHVVNTSGYPLRALSVQVAGAPG